MYTAKRCDSDIHLLTVSHETCDPWWRQAPAATEGGLAAAKRNPCEAYAMLETTAINHFENVFSGVRDDTGIRFSGIRDGTVTTGIGG